MTKTNNAYKFNPEDWELVEEEPKETNKFNPEDWELVNEPYNAKEEEGLGKSLLYAPFRIAKDIGTGIYHGAQNIPELYRSAKTEVPGVYSLPGEHPYHGAMQALAGSQEAINSLAQSPKNLASYFENRLNLLPQGSAEFVGKHLVPEDTTEAINYLFDKPQYAGESLLRGGIRNIPNLIPAAKLASKAPHLTKRGAIKKLKEARKLGSEKNMGPLNINPEYIEDLTKYLPDDLPYREALNAAKHGDYNALFNVQSDVGKRASKYANSWFSPAEREFGRNGLSARKRLINDMHNALQEEGHHDVSDLFRQGQEDFRRYMKFKPYRNALAVAALTAAIPKGTVSNVAKKFLLNKIQ